MLIKSVTGLLIGSRRKVQGNYRKVYSAIKADYVGKVAGSTVENPNIFKAIYGSPTLGVPSVFTSELATSWYGVISTLDNNTTSATNSVNTNIVQQLFSFNLIKIFENKYGTIPCSGQTVSDKVAWLKANIYSLVVNWYGYGSCPSGNKAYLDYFGNDGFWGYKRANTSNTKSNTSISPTVISIAHMGSVAIGVTIDDNGFCHFLAYTDPSNGTIASIISTDYIVLYVTFK